MSGALASTIRTLAASLGTRHLALQGGDAALVAALSKGGLTVFDLPAGDDAGDADRVPHDLLVCVNTVERAAGGIDAAIEAAKCRGRHVVFIISTTFSDRTDPNGDNLTRALDTAEGWRVLLVRHFPGLTALPTPNADTCLFLSWTAGRETLRPLRRVAKLSRLRSKAVTILSRLRRDLGLRRSHFLKEADLLALLAGRTVALVGNARSLGETHHGDAIDACDIVIRCNRGPIIRRRSHGSRTDWLAISVDLPEEVVAAKGASHVLWMSPRRKSLPAWFARHPRAFLNPQENNARLAARISGRPSTGLMVIDLLARSSCLSVDLFGFDFYQSQSLSGTQTKATTPHDYDTEEAYVAALCGNDPRFRVHR